jgi:chemotaxis-related protein WspD
MENLIHQSANFNDCWNQIGVEGDRTCPQLKTYIHCRNCPVYSSAGRGLLEREAPDGYRSYWTQLLAETQGTSMTSSLVKKAALLQGTKTISAIVFRLGEEWVALPAKLFKELTPPTRIHSLPHRTDDLLLGLANVRGEILMCVSLFQLLNIPPIANSQQKMSPVVYQRMAVVVFEGNSWVFTVDEVYGVHRFQETELGNAPAVISKAQDTYTIGTINWHNKKVNYLDAELLFYNLNRRVL